MPKLGKGQRLRQGRANQDITEDDLIDYSDERVTNVLQEAAYCTTGGGGVTMAKQAVAHLRASNKGLPTDSNSTDPGAFLELMWRLSIRVAQPGAAAMYEQAQQKRSFRDTATEPTISPEMLDPHMHQRQIVNTLRALSPNMESPMADVNEYNAELARNSILEGWGDCSALDKCRLTLTHLHVATNVRPHGFASVGKVSPGSPLGQLLLHGLQLFMAISFDDKFKQKLDERHRESACIYTPALEHLRTAAYYEGSTHTPLPPASTMVPVFDHCSLHNQMLFVSQVMEGLLLEQGPLPPDSVYTWSAFNKLLGLGLLAPIEEAAAAAAAAGSSAGALAAAAADVADLAVARQAAASGSSWLMSAAVSQLRVSLHDNTQQQQQLGLAAMHALAAAAARDSPGQQQQQQRVQEMLQRQDLDLGSFFAGSSSSSSNGSSPQQQQQQHNLLFQSCLPLAWAVAINDVLVTTEPQLRTCNKNCSDKDWQEKCADFSRHVTVTTYQNVLQTALDAAAAPAAAAAAAAVEPQQQQQQHDQQFLQQLLGLLLPKDRIGPQLQQQQQSPSLIDTHCPNGSMDHEQLQQQRPLHEVQHVQAPQCSSSSNAATHQADADPAVTVGLETQQFVNCALNILLQRVLSQMPPADSPAWTHNNTSVILLQMLLDLEHIKSLLSHCASLEYLQALIESGLTTVDCKTQQQQQQQPQQQQQQLLPPEANKLLCSVLGQMRKLAAAASTGSSNSSSQSQSSFPAQQQQGRQQHAGSTAAAAAAGSSHWRDTAMQMYGSMRPSGLSWLEHNFDDVSPDNEQPGFWGLVRYFLSASALNLRRHQDPEPTSAASALWIDPGWDRPDFQHSAWFSKQAARVADKALAMVISRRTVNIGLPIHSRTLQQVLRLACLSGEFPTAPLPYADLTAAAAAAARPYPDPDLDLTDLSVDMADLADPAADLPDQQYPVLSSDVADMQTPAADLLSVMADLADQEDPDLADLADPDSDHFTDASSISSMTDAFVSPLPSLEGGAAEGPAAAAAAAPNGLGFALPKRLFRPAAAAAAPAGSADKHNATLHTAAAAAAAAAARWRGPALHLSEFTALGPMFAEQQQQHCLAQLMSLIAQYYADQAAAAAAATGSLWNDLQTQQQQQQQQQRQPRFAAVGNSKGSAADTTTSSSKLMILLLGLYHLDMLQQQQQQQHSMTAAAGKAASPYADLHTKLQACNAAVAAAQNVMDLLLYCAMPDWAGGSSSGSSSSSMVDKLSHDYVRLVQVVVHDDLRAQEHQQQQQQHAGQQQRVSMTMLGLDLPKSSRLLQYDPEYEQTADVTLPCRCDSCSTDLQQISSGIFKNLHGVNNRPKLLSVCAGCGAAVMCANCLLHGPAGSTHRAQHCRVLQDLWQQQLAAAAAAAWVGEAEASGRELVTPRRPQGTGRYSPANPTRMVACRCGACSLRKRTHSEWLCLRYRHTPLHLLLLLPQLQQQPLLLYDAHQRYDKMVMDATQQAYYTTSLLYIAANQSAMLRDSVVWQKRQRQQQEMAAAAAAAAAAANASSSNGSSNPKRSAAGGSASRSSSKWASSGAGVSGLRQQQQQQQRSDWFGAGLSFASLFGAGDQISSDDDDDSPSWLHDLD